MTGSSAPVPPPPERMATVLAAISARARRTNLVRVEEIRAALERAGSDGLDGSEWAAAERTAHQLAGSAGTFGFAGVSERARRLERLFAEAPTAAAASARLAEARTLLDQASEQLAGEPELD